ncbi:Rv3654c family TadE-like protein [Cryptosporangium aurantiacum]|uniref:Rv3654c family TadE-like protein n=1 Tax=Cryptosporangium aurantiacum TaxID=134849 RepID=UPI0015B95AFD|nr:Rv3654c family TadE-like protein [Cryptosporangium aurantiacum]
MGSASVLALSVGLALLTVALGFQAVGGAAVARHRAGLAADLAALAGALHLAEGATAACARARVVAAENGADLVGCAVVGADLTATVTVVPRGPAALVGRASARARAGPVAR